MKTQYYRTDSCWSFKNKLVGYTYHKFSGPHYIADGWFFEYFVLSKRHRLYGIHDPFQWYINNKWLSFKGV